MINIKSSQNRNAAGFLLKQGLYDPEFEHDSCGIGFLAKIDNVPQHDIVKKGFQVLMNLEHRGAVGGDKSTGDGAGLLLQIPHNFFREECQNLESLKPGDYAVGMIFLPSDKLLAEFCKTILENIVEQEGCQVINWRQVPVNTDCLGALAKSTEPQIHQVFLERGKISRDNFEQKLYVIRRLVEKEIANREDADTSQFYFASLSSRTIIYKGLFTSSQLHECYPDLNDERFKSAFALVHSRYSTNTLPTWNLAQPFRLVAHNGEFNTLRGNIIRMKTRETGMKSDLFRDDIEKIKPVIVEGGSDSVSHNQGYGSYQRVRSS